MHGLTQIISMSYLPQESHRHCIVITDSTFNLSFYYFTETYASVCSFNSDISAVMLPCLVEVSADVFFNPVYPAGVVP